MPVRRVAMGGADEATHPDSHRAAVAEFFSTLIFVYAAQGSVMACAKMTGSAPTNVGGLVAIALAHGLAFFVGVAVATNISGGHVNPAVTFGALVGGHVSLLRAVMYWIAQLLGSVVACLLLMFTTGKSHIPVLRVAHGVGAGNALVFEIVMTFGLVYTVYATAIDAKRGRLGVIAPLAIGLIVAANILASGAFEGASMNPARAFGPALVSWSWRYQWIHWVGPFLGAGLAGLIYEHFMTPIEPAHRPLTAEDY
ncbi:hypothetical protein SUGI_0579410 [Cryptomeria japonica]|uniref:aquaporin TIP1-1 n=1 Tax=Cryptomeria japonica TaxID=3369 RepID=UPI0024149A83|nr:aquaporin TIP1-1 [Cryptomeria japonica]GLJ29385.1 hypothetical protein SUGI_0579410 [Cryptomeria japonica]